MALVDQRDIPQGQGHMVMDIFKDISSNLRSVEGFDLVPYHNITPYAPIKQSNKQTSNSFDYFENYWYKKFIYDFDGSPKVRCYLRILVKYWFYWF